MSCRRPPGAGGAVAYPVTVHVEDPAAPLAPGEANESYTLVTKPASTLIASPTV